MEGLHKNKQRGKTNSEWRNQIRLEGYKKIIENGQNIKKKVRNEEIKFNQKI